ncbi:hypothetical protein Pcinc_030748 [Petrolisthes cinctipes]|uniref:Uncharacterized protein n=1 Tax=Petrolisthes cinctipes TaxID=88211 RepID=A0AAE1EY60_PETCI|nr:hypothetical protein Pcinc_030748 [Petrolisthes cinctipes]
MSSGSSVNYATNSDTETLELLSIEPKSVRFWRLAKQVLIIFGASIPYAVVGISTSWLNVLEANLVTNTTNIYGTPMMLHEWQIDTLGTNIFLH